MSERELNIGTKKRTKVVCMDEPGPGNACHRYHISPIDNSDVFAKVLFQKGPIEESGINGCHNEDLIAIVLDRLYGFQGSEYKCRENAIAITKLEEALLWLKERTAKRTARGVEGTHIV